MTRYFSFWLEAIPAEYLDAMVATQLWGEDEKAVLNWLALEGIRGAITDKLIPLRERDEEDPEASAPERLAPKSPYKCEHCRDGLDSTPEGITVDGNCPKCGILCEIPF